MTKRTALATFLVLGALGALAACAASPRPGTGERHLEPITSPQPGALDAGIDAIAAAGPSAAPVVALAASDSNACSLHQDGSVSCWGAAFGPSPRRVEGVSNVVAIDARNARAWVSARTSDGAVWLLEERARKLAFTQPAVESGGSCALFADGTGECVADDGKVGHVRAIAHPTRIAGQASGGCIAHDGVVSCWSRFGVEPDVALADVEEVVFANDQFRCARTRAGEVACWGLRSSRRGARAMAVPPPLLVPRTSTGIRDAVTLAASSSQVCAVKRDRTSVCFAASFDAPIALTPGPSDVDVVAPGRLFTCALAHGTVSCRGANDYGQLGIGLAAHRAEPRIVDGVADATSVRAGLEWSCARSSTGKVACWGKVQDVVTATPIELTGVGNVVEIGGHMVPWMRRDDGTLIARSPKSSHYALPKDLPKSEGFSFYFGGCSIANGSVRCFDGMDGNPNGAGITDATQVATGGRFACVLRRSGDIVALTPEGPAPIPGFTKSVSIAASYQTCCSVRTDGGVDCHDRDQPAARTIAGIAHATRVSVEAGTVCALADGAVWCAGESRHGECGVVSAQGTLVEARKIPLPAAAVDVSVGDRHVCAALTNGTVACWGQTLNGESGGTVSRESTTWQTVRF
jgi:hypothetical protein